MKKYLVFLWAVLLLLSGCSHSGNAFSSSPPASAPQVATVRVNQVLLRAVPSEVTQQRFSGFDSSGLLRYGPETRDKAAVIELQNVSTAVVRLQIEYLRGETVIGLGSVALALTPGETVEVNDPPFQDVTSTLSSLQVTPGGATIANGSSQQFMVTGTFVDNTQLDLTSSATWSSSNPAVATVAPGGLAGAQSPGQTTITAAVGSVTGSTTLTVSPATISSIQVTPNSPAIAAGTTQDFLATATLTDGTTQDITTSANWTSDNTDAATIVADTGVATGVAVGQSQITATFGQLTGTAGITVTPAVLQSLAVNPPEALSAPGAKRRYQAIGTFSDGSTQNLTSQVTWSASDTGVTVANDNLGPNIIGQARVDVAEPFTAGSPITITATLGSLSSTADLHIGAFAYAVNYRSSNVSVFTIDPATGSLTAGAAVSSGTDPSTIAVDPTGRFAYVPNSFNNNILVFAIDPATGALTPRTPAPAAASTEPIVVDPTGRFVYTASSEGSVSVFTIDPITGTLTPGATVPVGTFPEQIVVDPTGRFVYVTNFGSNDVSVFTIDPATGALTPGTAVGVGALPGAITVDPTGRFVYVGHLGFPNIMVFNINSTTGALNLTSTATANLGQSISSIAIDPAGRYAFTAGTFTGVVSPFTIDSVTGGLAPGTDSFTSSTTLSMTVDPSGRFVYAAVEGSDNVAAFTINPATGALGTATYFGAGFEPNSVVTTP